MNDFCSSNPFLQSRMNRPSQHIPMAIKSLMQYEPKRFVNCTYINVCILSQRLEEKNERKRQKRETQYMCIYLLYKFP